MGLPDLVLIHGGGHAADCWDLTNAELRCTAPKLRVLAVDLPGRRAKPGDLRRATIRDWADSVVTDIDQAGLDKVVVAGHSMAGLVMPGVVTKLGATRVREVIFRDGVRSAARVCDGGRVLGPGSPIRPVGR
jgi:pimeloyl-ACP methyl ester carboxylesterase